MINLDELNQFVRAEIVPLEQRFLQDGFGAVLPAVEHVRTMVQQRGWWCPPMPVNLGGMGMPLTEFAHVSEALGRTPIGHVCFNVQAPDIGNMELLHGHGSTAHHADWLAPLAAGRTRSCFAMTEPEFAGSNPVHMATLARDTGDHYEITGHKWFTSAADGAAFAIVMAVTNPDAAPHLRASQIIVPMDAPGMTIVRNIKVMGEPGEGWASHAELLLDRVKVPKTNRIGAEGAGFTLAQERLGPGRIHHCMRWIGICERAYALMCERAATRALAPGRMLGEKQSVQHAIADSRAEISAARLLVLDAAEKIEKRGQREARIEIGMIKYFVAGVLQRVLDRAIQVHGALGVTDDTPLSYWYRHERAARIYDGADEVHKNVVARHELRKFGLDVRSEA